MRAPARRRRRRARRGRPPRRGGRRAPGRTLDCGTDRPHDRPPAPARTLRAVYVREPPRVDGRLDDRAWAAAPASGDFTQRAPRAGLPATQRTEVRVAYDRDALYVAVRCFDARPDLIGRQLARRDPDGIYSDWVHVGIDSYRDRRTGFRFSLNPRGVQGDGFLFDDTEEDALWDAVWTGAARVDAEGWVAELRIPFSQLRFSRAALDQAGGALPPGAWGFNVVREVARTGEESWWAPTPPDAPGVVSRFGTLAGLDSLGAPSTLELVPYARTQLTAAPTAGDPLARPRAGAAAAGLDLRWRLPHNLTSPRAPTPTSARSRPTRRWSTSRSSRCSSPSAARSSSRGWTRSASAPPPRSTTTTRRRSSTRAASAARRRGARRGTACGPPRCRPTRASSPPPR
jgi:hypothetical protein